MCFWPFKKKQELTQEIPVLTQQEVITELEYDIEIHEFYAVAVVEEPHIYSPSVYGDHDWHIHWIEVYNACIYYLKRSL